MQRSCERGQDQEKAKKKGHGTGAMPLSYKPQPQRYYIVGMTKLAPSLTPDGQRPVTVLVRV